MLEEILPIFSLVSAIFVVGLGVFVFLATKRSKSGIIFYLFCISIAIWLFSAFKMLSSKEDVSIIFWDRMVYVGVVFIPILMYHFGLVFTKLEQKQKKILWLGYILSFVFLILSRTNYFVEDLYRYNWGTHTQARFFHHIFLAFFAFYIFIFFLNVYRYYKKTTGIEKMRAKYILLSFGFLNIGGIAYLPAYEINISPLIAYLAELIGAVILALAITRYHLFKIKVLLTELLIGVMAITLLILPFLMTTLSLKLLILLTSIIFFLFCVFGYYLVRATYQETERRKEAEKLVKEFARLDKAKNQFILSTQHHLRTPLSIMKGYISLILEGTYGKLNPKIKEKLESMQKANQRLINLINDFLDITQFQVGKDILNKKEVQIEDLINQIVEELKPEAEKKKIYLKFEKSKTPSPKLSLDPEKFKEVIFNIVDNGIKYTSKGGITIKVRILDSSERWESGVQIQVKDTGIGMAEEEVKEVFDRFFERGEKAKEVYAIGRGIGLYIANQIIKAHNGRVWAESPGKEKGSTFYIEVPLRC